MRRKNRLRIFSTLMGILMLIGILPTNVSAGHVCPVCDEWIDGDPYCQLCYCCENCTTALCDECGLCMECVNENGIHCPACEETCLFNASDSEYCQICGRCENCCDLLDSGGVCRECYEENADSDGLCSNCGNVVILGPDGEEFEECAECGVHCQSCFDEYVCPNCGECTLCSGAELCEYCGLCMDCAEDPEYHCPICGNCYENTGRCWDDGEHCVNCCYDNDVLCDNCGVCTEATGKDLCPYCHFCEDCYEENHCPLCGECYESVGRCEAGGDHCVDCCVICEWCGECAAAKEQTLCDYCGYCEECCRSHAKEITGSEDLCAYDPQRSEKLKEQHQASGKHVYGYYPVENGHVYGCLIEGCNERGPVTAHRPGDWEITVSPSVDRGGTRVRRCLDCRAVLETETMPQKTFQFTKQPVGGSAPNGEDFLLDYVVTDNYGSTKPGMYVCAFCRKGTEEWNLDLNKAHSYFTYDRIRYSADLKDTSFEWMLCLYSGDHVVYSEPFTVTWGETHKHEYVLRSGIPSDTYGKEDCSGTCHQYVCSCGASMESMAHIPVVVGNTQTCTQKGYIGYVCAICGEMWACENTGTGEHISSGIYISGGDEHYTECRFCNIRMDTEEHVWETVSSVTVCDRTTKTLKCTLCGETRTVNEKAEVPSHTYGNWMLSYDDNHHWEYCTKCGYKHVEPHHFVNGTCDNDRCSFTLLPDDVMLFVSDPEGCSHIGAIYSRFVCSDSALSERLNRGDGVTYRWFYYAPEGEIVLGTQNELIITPELEQSVAFDETRLIHLEATYDDPAEGTVTVSTYSRIEPLIGVEGQAPTCAQDGWLPHYVCTCGRTVDQHRQLMDPVLPATGNHTYTDDCDSACNFCGAERIASHYFEDHFNAEGHYRECSACGLIRNNEPHTFTVTVIKEASCYGKGEYVLSCSCGYHETKESPQITHKIEAVPEKASTCCTQGYAAHYHCVYCGKVFTDSEGKNAVGLASLRQPLDPNNHEGGKYHYNTEVHWILCACGAKPEEGVHTIDDTGACSVCSYHPDHFKPVSSIIDIGGTSDDVPETDVSTEDVPETEPTSDGDRSHRILIILGICLFLLILAVTVILLAVRNKKKQQKDQPRNNTAGDL